mgnify:CR=1 FL=1
MKFTEEEIKDLYYIELSSYKDERGYLKRNICLNELEQNKIPFGEVKQSNLSYNAKAKTLRGFHYQSEPNLEKKIISCLKGSIHNIVIDLRKESKSFLKWKSFLISEKKENAILVPEGCANAFLTLEDHTSVLYFHSEFYNPSSYKSMNYNDKQFNFDWPHAPMVISNKDKKAPFYETNK